MSAREHFQRCGHVFAHVVPWIGISQIVISITPPVWPVNLNSQMHSILYLANWGRFKPYGLGAINTPGVHARLACSHHSGAAAKALSLPSKMDGNVASRYTPTYWGYRVGLDTYYISFM
ncbi:hypothetical protein B0H13DRAFT_1902452 [Mycena leptocephala]|nr:hypothetical protein B0H13DRAFT_1902452 [Mycena leptocephala]